MSDRIPPSILIGYLYGEISEKNRKKVKEILENDERIRNEYLNLKNTLEFLRSSKVNSVEEFPEFKFRRSKKKSGRYTFYKVAAVLIFVISLFLFSTGVEINYARGNFSFKVIPFWMKRKDYDRKYILDEVKKYIVRNNMENKRELNESLWRLYTKVEEERAKDKLLFRENILQMRDLLLNVVDNPAYYNGVILKSKYKTDRKVIH